nr:tRNA-dihydrouridine synthase [Colwellia sp.]
FPQLEVSINGGIKTLIEANEHLQYIDGVMIGREIYNNPYMLSSADQHIYGVNKEVISRQKVIDLMADYIDVYIHKIPEHGNNRAWHVLRHMLGFCNGLAGARQYRRYLSECAGQADANGNTLKKAFAKVTFPS